MTPIPSPFRSALALPSSLSRTARRLVVLLVVAAVASACMTVKKPRTQQPTMQTTTPEPVDVERYADTYAEHDAVWLSHNTTIENTAQKMGGTKWKTYRFVERRYVLLNPESESFTTIEISVAPGETLSMVDLQVAGPDGATQRFGKADLSTEPAEGGGTTYKLAYPDVQKGSVIQEVFEISVNNLKQLYQDRQPQLYYDEPFQFSNPADSVSFTFSMPNWWQVDSKDIDPKTRGSLLKVERDQKARDMTLYYTATDVPPVKEEPFSPYFKEMAKYATIQIKEVDLGSAAGYYKAPESWPEVADQIDQAAIDKKSFFSPAVRKKTSRLMENSGAETTEEKVEVILGYVYRSIEVNGQSDAEDFKDVIKGGSGNVYLVTGLTQAMLAEVDIPSDYLFVHSAQRGHFDRGFVTTREVQMPALRVAVGGGDARYLFPFLKQLPPDVIPEPYQGQPALAVSQDGEYKGFTEIPRESASQNVTEDNYEITIREDGTIEVVEERVLRGVEGYLTRQALLNLTDEERTEELREQLTYTDGDVEWTSEEVVNLKTYEKPLRLRLSYTIDNLVTMTPEEVLFQTSGLFSPLTGTTYKINPQERTNPIRINYTQTQSKHVEIDYPNDWTLTTELSDVAFENRFGSISGTYTVESTSDGPTLVVDQEVTLQRSKDGPEGMTDLVRLVGSKSDLQIPTLVFGTTGDETASR